MQNLEVAKAKQRVYIHLCVRLDNKEGENDLEIWKVI